MEKLRLRANIGWLKGMRVGKKVWFHDKLYRVVDVGSFSSLFEEIENPSIHYKALNNLKIWVKAIWKSFLWGLKKG